jgi:hypothetical protein
MLDVNDAGVAARLLEVTAFRISCSLYRLKAPE